jgi:hypothetical protein
MGSSRGLRILGSMWALVSPSVSILVSLRYVFKLEHFIIYISLCNSRIHVITLYLSRTSRRTHRNRDFKTDDLDDTRTRLQHAQDELVAAQSYVHHLEIGLHERDEQLDASHAQAADLQHQVEHLQELIPPEHEEPGEIEGMSDVDDD